MSEKHLSEQIALPAFIKAVPGMEAHAVADPFRAFDFWSPERIGLEPADYAAGQRHFHELLACGRHREDGGRDLLASVLRVLQFRDIGPIENGFLDELMAKATWGRVPDPMPDALAQKAIDLAKTTIEEIRHGETQARIWLNFARMGRSPKILREQLEAPFCGASMLSHPGRYGAMSCLWTICGAAVAGAKQ